MKYLIPILIVALALVVTFVLVSARPEPVVIPPEQPSVLVQVQELRSEPVTFQLSSQGSVMARTETTLVTEVPGRVVEVAPALAAGGKFDAGAVLLRIDASDFETELRQAMAQLKKAETQVATENALAGNALKDWQVTQKHGGYNTAVRSCVAQTSTCRSRCRVRLTQGRSRTRAT